jgi:hypothetical protein
VVSSSRSRGAGPATNDDERQRFEELYAGAGLPIFSSSDSVILEARLVGVDGGDDAVLRIREKPKPERRRLKPLEDLISLVVTHVDSTKWGMGGAGETIWCVLIR